MQSCTKVVCAIALMLGITATAGANSIDYADFVGDSLVYIDVTESSGTDPVPLFGEPDISGDVLDFDPEGFTANATDSAADITDGQLNFEIALNFVGTGMTSLLLQEEGDYSLFGAGTALTQIAAALSVSVDILEVDGVLLDNPVEVFANVSFTDDLSAGMDLLSPWSMGLLVDFAPALAAADIDFEYGVTWAEVAIDNQLIAISEDNSVAFIAKKDLKITPEIVGDPVPEPASLALMLIGGITMLRRNK